MPTNAREGADPPPRRRIRTGHAPRYLAYHRPRYPLLANPTGAGAGITLIAGFASTVGWPASALFLDQFGWRWACLIWAALNLFFAGTVNLLLIPRQRTAARPRPVQEIQTEIEPPRGAMPILAFFFSATWFVQGAMAAHLPGLLIAAGASPTTANRRGGDGRSGPGRRALG